jgi:hypothetical protein
MNEYFIVANSRAAPFVSDQSTHFVAGDNPHKAIAEFARNYSHPCGLFAAELYENANSYHKGERHLTAWYCPEAYSQAFPQSRVVADGIIV